MNLSSKKKFLGIEIGGTKLQFALGNMEGAITQQQRYTINPAAGAAGIQELMLKTISEIGVEKIAATGVGFGGPVNWKTGVIQTSHQVEGWVEFPLKNWLQQVTQAPVQIDNDANVATLAEAIQGRGKDYQHIFYITIGSGIGGGVVTDGKIYHGAVPGEAEIGHICLSKDGDTLESACSGWAVNKKIRSYINEHPQSLLAQLDQDNTVPEAYLLKPALEKKDLAAQQIIVSIAGDIAFALSHVVHLFHPQLIIIGGGLSLVGEDLRRSISELLPQYIMKAFPPPPILIAALGETVVLTGALELAKQTYHEINNKQ